MAEKSTVRIQADQRQLRGLYAALREMDKDSQTQLKSDVTAISGWTAEKMRNATYALGSDLKPGQAIKVGLTIRANKDRIPNVTIGGTKQRFSGGAVSGQVLFGSEFGSNRLPQFPNRSGNGGRAGHWIFPTLKRYQGQITKEWKQAVEKVLDNWDKGAL